MHLLYRSLVSSLFTSSVQPTNISIYLACLFMYSTYVYHFIHVRSKLLQYYTFFCLFLRMEMKHAQKEEINILLCYGNRERVRKRERKNKKYSSSRVQVISDGAVGILSSSTKLNLSKRCLNFRQRQNIKFDRYGWGLEYYCIYCALVTCSTDSPVGTLVLSE